MNSRTKNITYENLDWEIPYWLTNYIKPLERLAPEHVCQINSNWRNKDKIKTNGALLVLCLNLGIDPPDNFKPESSTKMHCWIDPNTNDIKKVAENIGSALHQFYDRLQPRARYKLSIDPSLDELNKNLNSLRKNSKDDRILFHYNGFGVPLPTKNGEIWVFDEDFTQYVPFSLLDLQYMLGGPSIMIYDCNCAELIINKFNSFVQTIEQPFDKTNQTPYKYIQLASCSQSEYLPISPYLPADIFTCCLLTPIKMSVFWYLDRISPKYLAHLDLLSGDKIPGSFSDRRTPLGELHWIFTAITDTIAWNVLPIDLFQSLFRHDLIVASLFRNFLLAQRIMPFYNTHPVSSPPLPPTNYHHYWKHWDFVLDKCLIQLLNIEKQPSSYENSTFFADNLTAFENWLLSANSKKTKPEQLPIVLQVLLSQVHRSRALSLLCKFLDIAPWAIHLSLSVGIFPYVVKLLQSQSPEIKPMLIFIWSKIVSVEKGFQNDLLKENCHKYFINALSDEKLSNDVKAMAAYVITKIMNKNISAQIVCAQSQIIDISLESLSESHDILKQALCLCIANVFNEVDENRFIGLRDRAPEKLFAIINDSNPTVRCCCVLSLTSIISNSNSNNSRIVDEQILYYITTLSHDCDFNVRKQVLHGLSILCLKYWYSIVGSVQQVCDNEFFEFLIHTGKRLKSSLGNDKSIQHKSSSHSKFNSLSSFETLKNLSMSTSPSNITKTTSHEKKELDKILVQINNFDQLSMDFVEHLLHKSLNSTHPSNTPMFESLNHQRSEPKNIPLSMELLEINNKFSDAKIAEQMVHKLLKTIFNSTHKNETIQLRIFKNFLRYVFDPYPEISDSAKNVVIPLLFKTYNCAKNNIIVESHDSNRSSSSSVEIAAPIFNHSLIYQKSNDSTINKLLNNCSTLSNVSDDRSSSSISSSFSHHNYFIEFANYFQYPLIKLSEYFSNKFSQINDPSCLNFATQKSQFSFNNSLRLFSKSIYEKSNEPDFYANLNEVSFQLKTFQKSLHFKPSFHIKSFVFHPFKPVFYLLTNDMICYGSFDSTKVNIQMLSIRYNNYWPFNDIQLINPHQNSLVAVCSNDMTCQIFEDFNCNRHENTSNKTLKPVSAFTISSSLSDDPFVLMNWNQNSGNFLFGGSMKTIKIWDSHSHCFSTELPINSNSCITSLSRDTNDRPIIAAGLNDGSVKFFDRRLASTECCVATLKESSSKILHVSINNCSQDVIISGNEAGVIKIWDLRRIDCGISMDSGCNPMKSMNSNQTNGTVICASNSKQINVINTESDFKSTISSKEQSSFNYKSIDPIYSSCLSSHTYFPNIISSCSTDGNISIFFSDNKSFQTKLFFNQ